MTRAALATAAGLALACMGLAGCGQTGPLYLPDAGGEVVTRPAPQAPAPQAPAPQPTAPQPAAPQPAPQPPRP